MQEGPVRMLIEPEGRNTAAAICAAALSMPPESLMLVLPSDHWIDSQAGFDATLAAMTPWAQQGYLMTIGITPDHPSPDYGYIEMGDALDTQSWRVQRFLEKPDTTLAETLIAQGNLWNSGIFLWRADRVLAEARHHCPEIVQTCEVAMQQAQEQDGMLYLEAIAWHACHAAPIDRAVLERTDRAAMTKAQFEWSDLGSFEALARRGIELA